MHTTNDFGTFIEVAEDCPGDSAVVPPAKEDPTIAQLHHELISRRPYEVTSDDVVFETYARRAGVPEGEWDAARAAFFAKGQPCLRSSPLGKRYGWGIHSDDQGRVALYPRGADEYARLSADPGIEHTRAMR